MSAGGLLLGLVNIAIVVVLLLLGGALVKWALSAIAGVGIPAEVVKLFLVFVALVAVYMIIALLFGLPTFRLLSGGPPFRLGAA